MKRPLLFLALLLLLPAAQAAPAIEITLKGLEGELRDNVLQRLAIVEAASRKDLDELRVERLHQQAEGDIRNALQPYGYYEPKIAGELSGEAPRWKARYTVDRGPAVRVAQIDIQLEGEGVSFDPLLEAAAHPLMRKGAVLRHEQYEETKTRLSQIAFANGFLDAQFTRAQLRVTPSAQTAEALLTMDTGPRYYFGDVTIEQEGLKPEMVQRYVRIASGGPYDPRQVLDTQFALSDLGYFDQVDIIPQRERAVDRHIPMLIRTTPRARTRYEIGAGYGTDTGARASTGVEFRRLNSYGHKLRLDARVSEIKTVLGGEYRIPVGAKPAESVSLAASSTREKFEDGNSLKYAYSISLNRTPGMWQRRVYLNYEHEESTIADAFNTSDLLLPGVSFNRGETDDPIHTRRGWNFFVDVHGAHDDLFSTATFLQTRAQLRAAYPLGSRVHLLGRAEVGASFVNEFSDLPASQRFFAGGDQSVRGYAYQSIGPRDENGKVVGGRYLTVLSGEAYLRVIGNWGTAAFIDVGGADDKPGPELYRGVGAGLRYSAPIGYINVDVAHPLDGDTSGVRLHISVRVGL